MTPYMRLTAAALLVTLVAVLGLPHPTYGHTGLYRAAAYSDSSTAGTERAGVQGDLVKAFFAAVTSMVFWLALAGVVVVMWLLTMLFSHLYSLAAPNNALAAVKWATLTSVILVGSLLAVMYIALNWGWVTIALLSIPVIVFAFAIWVTSER